MLRGTVTARGIRSGIARTKYQTRQSIPDSCAACIRIVFIVCCSIEKCFIKLPSVAFGLRAHGVPFLQAINSQKKLRAQRFNGKFVPGTDFRISTVFAE